jgi:hypothetical protein
MTTRATASPVTAAVERDDKFHAEYVPPPPPAPGKIVVRSPIDKRQQPVFPDLHLTPEQAIQLQEALGHALNVWLNSEHG